MSEEMKTWLQLEVIKEVLDTRREMISKCVATDGAYQAYLLGALGELDTIEGIIDGLVVMPLSEKEDKKP